MAFGSRTGKPVGARLKLWDRDPVWGPLPSPCGGTLSPDPSEENLVGFLSRGESTLGGQEPPKQDDFDLGSETIRTKAGPPATSKGTTKRGERRAAGPAVLDLGASPHSATESPSDTGLIPVPI